METPPESTGISGAGGGVANGGGTMTLSDCTVSGNSAVTGGGGVIAFYGTTTLTNCTVSGNSALNIGGGGIVNEGPMTVTNSIIDNNSAPKGGGVWSYIGTTMLSNCTVSGNSATATNGGGVLTTPYISQSGATYEGETTLTNSTVSGNSASGSGGGLFTAPQCTGLLSNCRVSDNLAVAGGGVYNSGTLNIASTNIINNQAIGGAGGALRRGRRS